MTLYLLPTGGIFASGAKEPLPTTVHIVSVDKPQCEVQIGDKTIYATDSAFTLPVDLPSGIHILKVDGRRCEGVVVTSGKVKAVGMDFRDLLPSLRHLCALEARLTALEEKYKETKVNYLF